MRISRPASKIVMAAFAAGVIVIVLASVRVALRQSHATDASASDDVPCGTGFWRRGTRCCPTVDPSPGPGLCAITAAAACPAPLVASARGCAAPEHDVVDVPATRVLIGPSDWEAEGRVRPRTVVTAPFRLDRLEVSVGRLDCAGCPAELRARSRESDSARAASSITLAEARAVCAAYGGRLPSEGRVDRRRRRRSPAPLSVG